MDTNVCQQQSAWLVRIQGVLLSLFTCGINQPVFYHECHSLTGHIYSMHCLFCRLATSWPHEFQDSYKLISWISGDKTKVYLSIAGFWEQQSDSSPFFVVSAVFYISINYLQNFTKNVSVRCYFAKFSLFLSPPPNIWFVSSKSCGKTYHSLAVLGLREILQFLQIFKEWGLFEITLATTGSHSSG